MLSDENYKLAVQLGEMLLGTCDSVQEAADGMGIDKALLDDLEFLRIVEDTVVLCEGCGWWCEPSEINEEGYCDDCAALEN